MVPQQPPVPKRYAPDREFPPYSHVPGRTVHPREHPEGHLYGRPSSRPTWSPPEAWKDNRDYLFAVDLFNHGFFWEAQDAWEGLWEAAREDDPDQALFLQGMIQLGAAFVQAKRGRLGAAEALAKKALERFSAVRGRRGPVFMGVDLQAVSAGLKSRLEPGEFASPGFRLELAGI